MSEPQPFDPIALLAAELSLPASGVSAVLALFGEGATVPFIARYRKEATGGLDEVQIRAVGERHGYLLELHARREAILESIASQGKLTDELRAKLLACDTKTALEDLYLPFRPKRRTRATIARERGLEPLAERMWAQPPDGPSPLEAAAAFVDPGKDVPDAAAALAGARDIVAERVVEDAEVRNAARELFAREGVLRSEVAPDKRGERTKFEQYYDFAEPVRTIPSHRFLAVRRGEREEVLRTQISVETERALTEVCQRVGLVASPWEAQLRQAIEDGFKRLLAPSVENDVRANLKLTADKEAVGVFASNLRNLLLAAPLGDQSVIGIDPGLRTGCKCAAVTSTGKYLAAVTIYPSRGADAETKAAETLVDFVRRHDPRAIAVGNGTAGRETEAFVRRVLKENGLDPIVVLVSEAGASVYSASDIAREEFPELDVTVRGAISIARRLQDPLAELVKIDPKSIGVGQYQHDVNQSLLKRKLDEVVESCVNHVGVQLNTASAPLLAHVAGIGASAAQKIVAHREAHGAFSTRKQLLKVSGVGPRTFEQAAGFLRIRGGEHPLDASAVHPERYALVERMAGDLQVGLADLVGNARLADGIHLPRYVDDSVGEPTLRDIVAELKKPGRDPRDEFAPPRFRDDVNTLADLKPGMTLEGVVTNVTHFGAFVDVGVKQDGLVHVSQLADRFVKDPAEVAKVGDRLQVRVLEVDAERKRISLTCRSETAPPRRGTDGDSAGTNHRAANGPRRSDGPRPQGNSRRDEPARQRKSSGFSYNPFANLLKK